MTDPAIMGLVVFAIIVLAVIWVFRHRIKIGIKGPAGMSLEVEAENAPPNQVPNATGIKQTGDRSVVSGGDITQSKVVTGDANVVADVVLSVDTSDLIVVTGKRTIVVTGNDTRIITNAKASNEERPGEEVFVQVHYATNRNVTGKTEPNDWYGSDRGELRYGHALVSIPKDHVMSRIERPLKIFWIEFSENPQKHVVLRAVEEKDEAQFFAALASKVARLQEKTAFVFIHGFNVTFAEATRRTAQMAYDLFLVGDRKGEATLSTVPILYSWPSNGEAVLYTHDANNAEASFAHLKAFLKDVAARSGAESITIIAHSMGSRTLTTALNEVGLEMRAGDGPMVKEIILAAPDMDRDYFLNIVDAVKRTGERMTLYASSRDKALQLSMTLNGFPRLGDATNNVVIFDGGESIDASAVGDDILAHSYYGGVSVLVDLYDLIVHGIPPDERFGLLPQGTPPNRHWIMRRRAGT